MMTVGWPLLYDALYERESCTFLVYAIYLNGILGLSKFTVGVTFPHFRHCLLYYMGRQAIEFIKQGIISDLRYMRNDRNT